MDIKVKILIIMLLSILFISTFCTISNADLPDVIKNPSAYNKKDEQVDSRVADKMSIILTIITNVGIIASVVVSAVLGIKYMMGSVEERADYKEGLFPYFVGAVLLFGVCAVVKLTQTLGGKIDNM